MKKETIRSVCFLLVFAVVYYFSGVAGVQEINFVTAVIAITAGSAAMTVISLLLNRYFDK